MNHSPSTSLAFGKDAASLPIFEGVEAEVLRELMSSAHMTQYQKGSIFLAQGAPVARFYILLEGWCGASKGNAEGQEALLQIFHHGDLLLECGHAVIAETSPMNLQALTAVQLLTFSPIAMRHAMEKSKKLMSNLLAASVRRCQILRDHIEQLALHSAEQRVGRFLLQMRFNTNQEGNDIVLPFDKSLVAAYLGIKPETLSRTLQSFRERGFVIERSHLTVPFRQALCDYCDAVTMQSCPFAHSASCSTSGHNGTVLV